MNIEYFGAAKRNHTQILIASITESAISSNLLGCLEKLHLLDKQMFFIIIAIPAISFCKCLCLCLHPHHLLHPIPLKPDRVMGHFFKWDAVHWIWWVFKAGVFFWLCWIIYFLSWVKFKSFSFQVELSSSQQSFEFDSVSSHEPLPQPWTPLSIKQ